VMKDLPPVTRVVTYGWYQDTITYYLMLNGSPVDAYDRNPPLAYTFEAYVVVRPGSTAREETDPFFWYGPVPIVRQELVREVEGFGIWKVIILNPR
jgi:hypothetical protein